MSRHNSREILFYKIFSPVPEVEGVLLYWLTINILLKIQNSWTKSNLTSKSGKNYQQGVNNKLKFIRFHLKLRF